VGCRAPRARRVRQASPGRRAPWALLESGAAQGPLATRAPRVCLGPRVWQDTPARRASRVRRERRARTAGKAPWACMDSGGGRAPRAWACLDLQVVMASLDWRARRVRPAPTERRAPRAPMASMARTAHQAPRVRRERMVLTAATGSTVRATMAVCVATVTVCADWPLPAEPPAVCVCVLVYSQYMVILVYHTAGGRESVRACGMNSLMSRSSNSMLICKERRRLAYRHCAVPCLRAECSHAVLAGREACGRREDGERTEQRGAWCCIFFFVCRESCIGYRGFPQGPPHPCSADFRR
jgi:hypothetical protein